VKQEPIVATAEKILISPEEYLVRERATDYKSDYLRGQTVAKAGASARHNLIVLNTGAVLRDALRKRPCLVYPSDLKLNIESTGLFTYPDITVVCGEPKFLDDHGDVLLNPVVIIEVLSESTEAYDRGKKFEHYRTILSLEQFVLIAQDRVAVDCFSRGANNEWTLRSSSDINSTLGLGSIQCEVPLSEIYDKVRLDPPEPLQNDPKKVNK
jgi:Uma2 family endonuclease